MACCVRGCKNRHSEEPKLHFYRLPVDQKRRELWVKAIGREDLLRVEPVTAGPLGRQSYCCKRVCSAHFITGKYSRNPQDPDYVPSLFSFCKQSEKMSVRALLKLIQQEKIKAAEDRAEHLQGGGIIDPKLLLGMRTHVAQTKLKEKMYKPLDDDIITFIYNPEQNSSKSNYSPAEGSAEPSQFVPFLADGSLKESQSHYSPADPVESQAHYSPADPVEGQFIYISENGSSKPVHYVFHPAGDTTEPGRSWFH